MFWRFGGYANISSIDSILDKPDVTLEELLDESDLIQELKQQNSKLIEFLREEPILHKLLQYVVADKAPEGPEPPHQEDVEEKTTGISFFKSAKSRSRSTSAKKSSMPDDNEDDEDKNEAQRKKYAYVACEVLSSEVWSITEALVEYQSLLREFWDYMKRPAPLDALQAGYFTKVNEALFDKKTDDMLVFFKSLDNIVPRMLQHVECPMIMDLLLKIVTLEKHEGGLGVVDWLQAQDLIPTLLSYLSSEYSLATQTAAGDFLKAIITISANATTQDQTVIGPNELTRQLVSEPCISTLIRDMLQGGNPLTVGVGIVIEVIRKNNSDYDLDNQVGPEPKTSDPIYLGTLLRKFAHHVPDFMRLVRSASAKKPDLKAAFGTRIEPLGFDRFKTCELMAELLHCSNMGLLNERGAEAEVKQRDAERERLKAEGKLTAEQTPNTLQEQFPSSVDSHGFHHAERPEDDLSGSPEEIKRLEVQNASDEDGYEKVAVPETETLPDEPAFDDFNERLDETGLAPLTKSIDPSSIHHVPEDTEGPHTPTALEHPLDMSETSPENSASPTDVEHQVSEMHLDSPEQADEPSSEGKRRVSLLTQQLQQQIQESELNDLSDQSQAPETSGQDIEMLPEHSEDKPAPLFASKSSPTKHSELESSSSQIEDETDSPSQSTATLQPNHVIPASAANEQHAWEADVDGSPVVGDLLKIMFVEHQVVPTILDFFFRFPWNNFLHNVVYDVVQQVFNGSFERGYNRTLAIDLFCQSGNTELTSTADVTQRILDGQAASDKSQQEKGMRLGYMGHLTLIAEEVLKLHDRQPPELLGEQIMERISREDWVHYLEGILSETRDRDNAVLGGVKPENAIGARQMGIGASLGGFTSSIGNNPNALLDAGLGGVPVDSMAMQESGDGSGYSISGGNGGGLLSGFGNGDDDEDMDDGMEGQGERREKAVSDDEQVSSTSLVAHTPAPLAIPPSRARARLAERLAAKKREATSAEREAHPDPDAEDPLALETASEVTTEPLSDLPELHQGSDSEDGQVKGLQVSGIRLRGSAHMADRAMHAAQSHFDDGLSSSSDTDSASISSYGSDHEDEAAEAEGSDDLYTSRRNSDDQGEDTEALHGLPRPRRRPSTTEAKKRISLDDEDDEDDDVDLSFSLAPLSLSRTGSAGSAGSAGSLGSVGSRGSVGSMGSGSRLHHAAAASPAQARDQDRRRRNEVEPESPFADPVEFSDGGSSRSSGSEESSSDDSDEGDIVEIKPRRTS